LIEGCGVERDAEFFPVDGLEDSLDPLKELAKLHIKHLAFTAPLGVGKGH
jgi:hypothetical protein